MPESFFSIDKALSNGLLPRAELQGNSEYLDEMYGLLPTGYGAIAPAVITDPVTAISAAQHKQYLQGETSLRLLRTTGELNIVSTVDWSLGGNLLANSISMEDGSLLAFTPGSGLVHFAEAAGVWVGTDGDSLFTNSPLFGAPAIGESDYIPVPSSVCLHKGRLILGGLSYTPYTASAPFPSLWSLLKKYSPQNQLFSTSELIDDSYIIIGAPGGGDVGVLFALELMLISGQRYSELGALLEGAIRERQLLVVRLPWIGSVLCVKSLENVIMIYGDTGIGLVSVDGDQVNVKQLLGFGVAGRDCVAGDNNMHCFVDVYGRAWVVKNEYTPILKDYRDFIEPILSSDTKVVFEQNTGYFYVTTESQSVAFVLTDTGFAKSCYRPLSLFEHAGVSYGIAATGSAGFTIVSHLFDVKRRGFKQVKNIQVLGRGLSSVQAGVDFRYTSSSTFARKIVPLNKEGIAWNNIQAVEVKPVVTGTIESGGTLDRIEVRWDDKDLRSVRGLTERGQNELT